MKAKNKSLDKVATHPLQTKAWKDFRSEWGNEIIETKYGIITVHKVPLLGKLGVFLRGPKPTKKMLDDLYKVAKENGLFTIKLEPNVEFTPKLKQFLLRNNCIGGKTFFTPTTFVIDLTKSEDELMKGFSSKTRYNVRYSKRKGVSVEIDNSKKAFEKYLALTRETVKRQKFYSHTEKYHRLMWKHLRKAGIADLLVAKHNKKILATWILFSWDDTLYYPYGASTHKHKNLQFNSAMMWAAIKYGKSKSLKKFDLWGREEGKGFTKFKEGFNPRIKRFIGTWDYVISPHDYTLYVFLDFARWGYLRLRAQFSEPTF